MAKARGQAAVGGIGPGRSVLPAELRARRRDRTGLLGTTALQAAVVLVLASPVAAQLAPTARPTGGQVVGGQVGISQSTQTTTVQQSTQHGAINWQTYNVGSSHTVQYQQPNAQASTLNRVIGPDPSVIAGRIQANGRVVLVNQSGVVFEKGAQVDVQGLIVTSNNIRTTDFMAGRMNFDQPGNPNARIVNHGTISVRESGLAALVAPSVANHGVINARMAKVVLAGATAHTVDLYGDGLIAVDVTGQVKQAPIGPDGKAVTVLVTNTGTILADGGTVVLTAKAVDGIVNNLVTAGGRIQANTVGNRVGRIEIAGVGGGLTVEGDLSAMGLAAGTTGGTVQVLATGDVAVAKGARIDASGQAGGGTVAVGTTLARAAGPSVKNAPMAARVSVERGATIAADALANGKGGSIVMLAAGTTRMNGVITARGGAQGGDGGFVEISGKTLSSITGKVDVTAPNGKNGAILIDPDFLTIVAGAATTGDQDATFTAGGGTIVAGDLSVPPDTLSNGVLNAFAGDVLLQANQTITVGANVSLTTTPGQALTLEAGGTITVNAGVVLTVDGNVFLGTGGANLSGAAPVAQANPTIAVLGSIQSNIGGVTLAAGTDGIINIGAAGSIQAATQAVLTATVADIGGTIVAPTISITASAGTIGLTGTLSAVTAAVMAGQAGIAGAAGVILGGGALTVNSAAGAVDLSNAANTVASVTSTTSTDFNFVNSGAVNVGDLAASSSATITAPTATVTGNLVSPSATLTATAGTLGITGTVNAATNATLFGQTGISGATGTILGGGLVLAIGAAGPVDLTNVNNAAGVIAGAAGSGAFAFTNSADLALGDIAATTTAVVVGPTLTAGGTITAPTVRLGANTGTLGVTGTIDASSAVTLTGQTGIAGASGTIIGGGTLSAISAAGNVVLSNAANAIAAASGSAAGAFTLRDTSALDLGAVTAGTTASVTAETLTVSGVITAPTAALSATVGALTLTGTVDASAVATLLGQGGIVGATGRMIGDGALTATAAGGAVDLSNVTNAIASATGTAGVGAFVLSDTGALDLGAVSATTSIAVGAPTLTASGAIVAPAVTLAAGTGTLGVTGTINATSSVDLAGQAGIAGATGRVIGNGTLSAIAAAGSVDLSNGNNLVAVASGSASTNFTLVNSAALNLGNVNAGGIASVSAPTLTASGAVIAPTVSLTASTGTLTLTGTVDAATAATLTGQAGIAGSAGQVIGGGALTANSGAGNVVLDNTANAVASVTGTAASDFSFANSLAITLGNITATGGNVFLRSTAVGGITFGPAATVTSVSGGRVTLRADALANLGTAGATGVINSGAAGTLELAPETLGGAMSLGSIVAGQLSLESLGGVTAGLVRIGRSTAPGGAVTTTAGTITVGGTGFDMASGVVTPAVLDLNAVAAGGGNGDVGQTAPLLTLGTLNGGATSFTLTSATNAITNIGSLSATGAAVVASGTVLSVGTVSAGTTAAISAPTLSVPGTVSAQTVLLTASTGTLTLGGTVNASIATALVGQAGIAGASGRVIGNGSLSAISAGGAVDLSGANNAIANASGSASASSGFALTDSVDLNLGNVTAGTTVTAIAPNLTISGTVAATTIDLSGTTGLLSIPGVVNATALVVGSAPTITVGGAVIAPTTSLTAGTGTLGLTGTVDASILAALSGQAGITGGTGRVIGGGSLSAISAGGSVDLSGANNAITNASGSASSRFALTDSTDLNLGNVTAGTTATVIAPNLTIGGTVAAATIDVAGTTGLLSVPGVLNATAQAIGSAPTVTIGGTVISPSTTLTASTGTLTLTGTVSASTDAALTGQAGIAGASGRVIGNGSVSAISAGGAVDLSGANNAIANASGSASASSGFALTDSVDLNLGNVTAGTTVTAIAPNLTISGTVAATTIDLSGTTGLLNIPGVVNATALVVGAAPTITVGGAVIAPTTSLTAGTGTLGLTGTVDASILAALSGQAGITGGTGRVIGGGSLSAISTGGSVDLSGANNAITNASGSASSRFALTDSTDLNLGNVTAGTTATVIAPNLTIGGTVAAATIDVAGTTGLLSVPGVLNATTRAVGAAPTITVSGTVVAPTTSLTASAGTLGLTGTVNATTIAVLSGQSGIIGGSGRVIGGGSLSAISTGGSVDLSNVNNAITNASGSASSRFALTDSTDLNLGNVTAGTTATVIAPNLTISGTVAAATIDVAGTTGLLSVPGVVNATTLAVGAAPTITVGGAVIAPTTSLTASVGTLGLTGTINASTSATLSGQAGIVAATGLILGNGTLAATSAGGAVDLGNTANAISTLSGSALNAFEVGAGTAVTIPGTVTADTVKITASSLTNTGTVTASGPGSAPTPAVQLIATGGTVSNAGLIRATDAGAGNVSVLASGDILSAGTITAAGPGTASAPSVSLTTTGGSITQTAGLIAATNAAGFMTLGGTAGLIAFAGTLMTGASTVLPTGGIHMASSTGITETVGILTTGAVVTGTLTATSGGGIALDNTATTGNSIATLGSIAASGSLSVVNNRDLTVGGPVTTTNGAIAINNQSGTLTNNGTIAAGGASAGTVNLIAAGGIINAANAVITGAGPASSPSVALTAGTSINNAAGATIAATNTTSGSVALTAGTDVTTAGTITAAGTFAGTPGIAITAGGTIAQTGGVISATHPAGTAVLNAGSIDLGGTVGVGGTLSLTATGRITQGGGTNVGTGTGTITAVLLTGSSGATTTLDAIANQIGTIGPFSAGTNLTLRDSAPILTTAGTIAVGGTGTLVLQNGVTGGANNLTLAAGSRLQATNVTLLAPGVIEGRSATIVATALTLPNAATGAVGTGVGVTALSDAILGDPTSSDPAQLNSVGSLSAVTATGSVVFMNAAPLLLAGDLSAPLIRIGATGGLTLASGLTVTTSGANLTLPPSSSPPPDTDATLGFNIALLNSTGTIDLGPSLTILPGFGASQPTFRIAQTQAGKVAFGNLAAPSTNVILHVGTGSASSAGGTNIDVRNLFVFYRSGAPSVALSGTVGGQTASGAATVSRIGRESAPASAFGQTTNAVFDPNAQYQINQCSITSVNCVLTATLQIPPLLPLQTLYLPLPINVLDDPDLLLPLISDQDD